MSVATAISAPAEPILERREVLATLTAVLLVGWIWTQPDGLTPEGRKALMVTGVTILGWTMTRIPDSIVAIGGAVALVLLGTLSEQQMFAALGRELVWLLMSAFVIAAVLKRSGMVEIVIARTLSRFGRFRDMAFALTCVIAATAFFLPSTSGRAALLLPVFVALAGQMPDARLVKPLALLFPTIILLSAGGSILGAGAHLVAVDAIQSVGGPQIGYAEWMSLALPVTFAICIAATLLILWLFVPPGLSRSPLQLEAKGRGMTVRQRRLAALLFMLFTLWMTTGLHNISIVLITLIGAVLALSRPFSPDKTKEVFRGVDMELILYLTATMVLADALIATGADRWLADAALAALPEGLGQHVGAASVFMAVVAVLSHLAINSRSARASVLIPAVALPVAAFGHDPVPIVMIAVLGTGFCQTLMVSAKPVAIFGNVEAGISPAFNQNDLFRLAVPLMPVVAIALVIAALFVWPHQMQADQPMSVQVTSKERPVKALAAVAKPVSETGSFSALAVVSSPRPEPRPWTLATEPAETAPRYVRRRSVQSRPQTLAETVQRDVLQAERELRRAIQALPLPRW